MKKVFIWVFLLMFITSLTCISVGCKEEAVPSEEVAEEETEEVEEAAPAVEEEEDVEVVAEEKLQFAFVCSGPLTNVFIAEVIRGWDAACDPLGIESTEYLAEYDQAQTMDFLNSAIASGVDGIFLFQWYDAGSFVPAIQQALDKGIDVATMTVRYPFPAKVVPFVGVNYKEQGYDVGEYTVEILEERGITSDVQIGVFHDIIASPLNLERAEGFYNALTDAGIDYEVLEVETGEDYGQSADVISASILANPEWDVIFNSTDITTLGSFKSLMDLEVDPDSIFCTGFNLEEEMIRGIRAGYGAINSDEIFAYGYLPAVALYARIAHGAIIGDLPVCTEMVDQTNLDDYTE